MKEEWTRPYHCLGVSALSYLPCTGWVTRRTSVKRPVKNGAPYPPVPQFVSKGSLSKQVEEETEEEPAHPGSPGKQT